MIYVLGLVDKTWNKGVIIESKYYIKNLIFLNNFFKQNYYYGKN